MIRRDQRVVGLDQDAEIVTLLDGGQFGALLVQNVEGDLRRHADRNLFRPLPGSFLFDGAQDRERGRFGRADQPAAPAGRAGIARNFHDARPQPLARHFQQAERADPADLNARAVAPHGALEAPFDRVAVAAVLHVDEIDDDQAGQVAQFQLARDFVGRFEVRLEGGLLDVALAGRPARIDVDRHQGLGGAQHNGAAGFELDGRALDVVDLRLDLIALEHRNLRFLVRLDPLGMAGDQQLHEILGRAVAVVALDQHFVDLLGIEIADRALDQVALFVDQGGRRRLQGALAYLVPQFDQIFVVAADFRLGALRPGGPDDHGHAVGNVEIVEDLLQPFAVGQIRDLSRDAAAARRIRHQHAIASGQGNVAGDRGALAAALFLGDLNQDDLPAGNDLLDAIAPLRAAPARADVLDLVAAHRIHAAVRTGGARSAAPAAARRFVLVRGFVIFRFVGFGFRAGIVVPGIVVPGIVCPGRAVAVSRFAGVGRIDRRVVERFDRLRFGIAVLVGLCRIGGVDFLRFGLGLRRFLLEQFLAVRDRDTIIVGMDFVEGEEAVPVSAIVDERRLKRRFDPGHLCKVNVSLQLGFLAAFEVEIVQPVAADDDHPGLFGVSRVNQHACRHRCLRTAAPWSGASRKI